MFNHQETSIGSSGLGAIGIKNLKVLVLGGSGFIGAALTRRLLTREISVRIFGRNANPDFAAHPNCEQIVADFLDGAQLLKALEGVDVVYHLVSTTLPGTSNQDPIFDVSTNLIGSLKLIQLMQAAGVRRIIFISSGGTVYGKTDHLPITETQAIAPLCSYGIVKFAIEKYLLMNEALNDLQPLIIRAANPYGLGQRHLGIQGIVSTFLQKIARNEELVVWGDGSARRDFIHISDLIALLELGLETDKTGVYHAGSGTSYSVNELIQIISDILGVQPRVNYLPARDFDVPYNQMDITRTQSELGWKPSVDLRDGLLACIKDGAIISV
jgi:UDP-glucose 4-epimerase